MALKIDIFGFRGLFEKWMRVGINIGKELIIQIIIKKTVKIKALKADQVLLISFSYVLVLLCFWGVLSFGLGFFRSRRKNELTKTGNSRESD